MVILAVSFRYWPWDRISNSNERGVWPCGADLFRQFRQVSKADVYIDQNQLGRLGEREPHHFVAVASRDHCDSVMQQDGRVEPPAVLIAVVRGALGVTRLS